jgi:hypothetical protein
MEKPNARGPTPSRKAHLALGEKLNRKGKPPPRLPAFAKATAGKPVKKSSSGERLMIGQ